MDSFVEMSCPYVDALMNDRRNTATSTVLLVSFSMMPWTSPIIFLKLRSLRQYIHHRKPHLLEPTWNITPALFGTSILRQIFPGESSEKELEAR